MRGAGLIFFINSEILRKHSLGIDTPFGTLAYHPTHNLGVLVQANGLVKEQRQGQDKVLELE